MKPYTVDELIMWLQRIKEHWSGEHIVLVSDDEEGNGYHPLYSWAATEGEPITYFSEETEKMETGKTVLIG